MVKQRDKVPQASPRRSKRLAFLMSDDEMKMVNRYLRKYHIKNRSRWMRETLLHAIAQKLRCDYPTLFSEMEMRR